MTERESYINDFIYTINKIWLESEVKHYIANYVWWFYFRISRIIDWCIKAKDNEIELLDEAIENMKIIETKIIEKDFREKLIKLHKEWKFATQEMINLILINNK